MKTILIISVLVSGLYLFAGAAAGQTATIQMFMDAEFSRTATNCPDSPVGTFQNTLYVVVKGFGVTISDLEYSIQYPGIAVWIGDDYVSGTVSGSTADGIRHSWTAPIDASNEFLVATVLVLWLCERDDCWQLLNTPICVVPHPESGFIRATSSIDQSDIYAASLGIRICPDLSGDWVWECWIPPVPTQDTSWGRIKSLYKDF